ncbi:MAG: hypothetical protein EXS18_01450 [Verrucomicrobiae bacterium]|nr:hypothetical protein [Verrucomicrobiae bacterium]
MQPRHFTHIVFAFVCGLYFALLQFSYFFLMEAFLTSQYLSYFIALFFWLCGFLVGLKLKREDLFVRLLIVGVIAYYVTWWMTRLAPFHSMLYMIAAICSVGSGMLAGYFFPFMSKRFQPIRSLLFHENNGFLLGILIALKASIYCGSLFLAWAPLLGAALVVASGVVHPRTTTALSSS